MVTCCETEVWSVEVVNLELAMLCTSSESKTEDSSSELIMEDDAAEASTVPTEAPGGRIPGPGRRGCLLLLLRPPG